MLAVATVLPFLAKGSGTSNRRDGLITPDGRPVPDGCLVGKGLVADNLERVDTLEPSPQLTVVAPTARPDMAVEVPAEQAPHTEDCGALRAADEFLNNFA